MKKTSIYFFLILYVLAGCNTAEHVLRSKDLEYKYDKAIEFYKAKKYYKAVPIFEELLSIYKGTKSTQEMYYFYADALFHQKQYYLGAYHFKSIHRLYPHGPHAEDALYKSALCYEKISSEHSLEQDNTYEAIDAYQLFINYYPNTSKLDVCNKSIDRLRRKLEIKSLNAAKQYAHMKNYKSATQAFKNVLREYPDIEEAEECEYMIVKNRYLLAKNSTYIKQEKRFKDFNTAYEVFNRKYPNTTYKTMVDKFFKDANYHVIENTYKYAKKLELARQLEAYSKTIRLYEAFSKHIKGEKYQRKANKMLENSYFGLLKSKYLIANKAMTPKAYNSAITSYYKYIDKYAEKGGHVSKAEKIFDKCIKKIDILKQKKIMNKIQLYKAKNAPSTIITQDVEAIAQTRGNIYAALSVVGKRANQVSIELKEELQAKLKEFASTTDNLEEVFENREQIEISKFYEKLPHSTLLALKEYLDGDTYVRSREEK